MPFFCSENHFGNRQHQTDIGLRCNDGERLSGQYCGYVGGHSNHLSPLVDERSAAVAGVRGGIHLEHVFEGASNMSTGDTHIDRLGLGLASQGKPQRDQRRQLGDAVGLQPFGQGQRLKSSRDAVDLKHGKIVLE